MPASGKNPMKAGHPGSRMPPAGRSSVPHQPNFRRCANDLATSRPTSNRAAERDPEFAQTFADVQELSTGCTAPGR